MTGRALHELTDEELRAEASRRGIVVGRSLPRQSLIELLGGEPPGSEEEPPVGAPQQGETVRTPVPTVTVARLYADQGHRAEAASVLRAVLSTAPDEGRARALLARLAEARPEPARSGTARRARTGEAPMAEGPGGEPATPLPERYGEQHLTLTALSPVKLHAFWETDPELLERAHGHVGAGAELVLRLFSAWRGPRGVERRTADVPATELGHRFIDGSAPGAVHRAAVGWLSAEGGFVPVVHSAAAETPAGRPSGLRRRQSAPVLRAMSSKARSAAAAERLLGRLHRGVTMRLPWEAGGEEWPEPALSDEGVPEEPEPLRGLPSSRS